ncbi:MAG TPA: glutamate racemase [Abditibacteriaceae bacterium]|nr:glutamate racemase [Abditibacteriaceae bacterium]
MSTASAPVIGIRDSGVGGLTVARRIRELLPDSPLLYFADTAHVPYGDRQPCEVRYFALSISNFLIGCGAQVVVFACNTSSAYALDSAQQKFDVPIIGMIEPGVCAAVQASSDSAIGVLATQATVNSNVYTSSIRRLRPAARCLEIACPEFVPLVEAEQTQTKAAQDAARRYLQPLLDAGADTIILGCTHYPLLLPVLQQAAPGVQFIDPADAVAEQVASLAENLPARLNDFISGDTFFVSGADDGVRHWIDKLLPESKRGSSLCRGPVFDVPS